MDTPSLGNAPFQKGNIRRATLTPGRVLEIRRLYDLGTVTQGQLSRDFGVSVVQIGRIVRGEVWQGLGPVAAGRMQLQTSAEALLEMQADVDRNGPREMLPVAPKSSELEATMTTATQERLALFRMEERVIPVSPLDE